MKSQAALEFLMTYGWGLFALLLVLSAVVYFGVSNPEQYAPRQCVFEEGIICSDFGGDSSVLTYGNGVIQLVLTNGVGQPINVTNVSVLSLESRSTKCTAFRYDADNGTSVVTDFSNSITVPTGSSFATNISCRGGYGSFDGGSVVTARVVITYIVNKPGYFLKKNQGTVVTDII